MSRSSLARKEIRLPLHELGLQRQLAAREAQRFLRQVLRDAGQLEHDPAGLDDCDPVLGCALPRAHARLGGLLAHRLVREDVDPHLPTALDLAGHGDTSGLDLAVRDPAGFQRLDAVVAELDARLALRDACTTAALLLAVLRLLGEEHQPLSPESSSFVGSSTCFFVVVVSGASATGASTCSTSGWISGCSRPSAEVASSSVRGRSTLSCFAPLRAPPPRRGRRLRTGPRPSRSCCRLRLLSREAERPSVRPPRRRAVSWSPRRVSFCWATLSNPSGMISPLLIQTFTPIRPYVVFASTKP